MQCVSCLKSCTDLLAELKYHHKCRQTKQARKLQDALKCLQFETMTYLLTDGGKV